MRKSFYSGLAAGLAVAGLATLWIGRTLDEPYLEPDSNRSLGMAFEAAPQVALRPMSVDRAARSLQYGHVDRALAEAEIFAQRIAGGYLPSGWKRRCLEEYHPSLCLGLDEYFQAELTKPETPKAIERRTRLTFTDRDIPKLQAADLGLLLSRAPELSFARVKAQAQIALATNRCARNYSIALARMLERHWETPGAWALMDQLDDHGFACVPGSDRQAEASNLRVALLRIARENYQGALPFLERAYAATTRRETHRTLYWTVKVHEKLGQREPADSARSLLVTLHPLSWQAIKTYNESGRDPLGVFRAVAPYPDAFDAKNPEVDRALNWHRLMARLPDAEFASQRFAESIVRRFTAAHPPGVYQHFARMLDHEGHHRIQIQTLTRLVSLQPERVTIETLRLLFPRPFFDQIDQWTPSTDTAILLGLARQESGFDPGARSSANAVGLLQVLPTTAKDVRRNKASTDDLLDAHSNIEVGAAYFEGLVKQFDGSVERALAAYNAGMGRVRGWDRRFSFVKDEQLYMDMIPYRETREYVTSILRNAYWYHRLFPQLTEKLAGGSTTSKLLAEQLRLKKDGDNP